MGNKRKAIRVSSTLEISFREVENDSFSGARGKNISETGICIPLIHIPAADSLLEVEIRSDGFKTSVKTIARVAWIVSRSEGKFPFEAGLEFLDLRPVERDVLRDYINRSAAKGGEQDIRWID